MEKSLKIIKDYKEVVNTNIIKSIITEKIIIKEANQMKRIMNYLPI
jgi:hypothetical protein